MLAASSDFVRAVRGWLIGLTTVLLAGSPSVLSACSPTVAQEKAGGAEAKAREAQDASAGAVPIDPMVPKYTPVEGVSGSIKSAGSDTMSLEMTHWGDAFRKHYPAVKIEMEAKGSGSAPTALEQGTASFGPMSREMKNDEIDKFEKKYGYKPTGVKTSLDVLAVYVHKDNPLKSLTLQQVDAIFSKNRKGGYKSDITTWGDLGLEGEWKAKPISLYGRNSASGTYTYFKDHALFGGDYKDQVKEQPGTSTVVQGVASDRFAIGYSGIGFKSADVRALPLAAKEGKQAFEATMENAYSSQYPLSRYLLIYVNKAPNKELDPLRAQFLAFVLSREGQEEVVKASSIPLPGTILLGERKKLGL